jgi:hypothetical protein
MKRQSIVIVLIFLFLTMCFSGCETIEEKDYITVVCQATIITSLLDEQDNTVQEAPVGLLLTVEFIKAGGERFSSQCTISTDGTAQSESGSFKLYREQNIEVVVTVQGGYKDYHPMTTNEYATLPWSTVEPTGFGKTYAWNPTLTVFLEKL